MHPKVTKYLPSEVNGCLVLIFKGKLCSLTQALWRLSLSSALPYKGYKLGSFRAEMQFDNFHSYSWEKSPVNTAGSEQGQPIFRRGDGLA